MPQTVPNRPMNGAVEPTEASRVRPSSSREETRLISWRRVRVMSSLGSVVALSEAEDPACARRLAASTLCTASGVYTLSLSTLLTTAIASVRVGAFQKPSSADALFLMRQALQ